MRSRNHKRLRWALGLTGVAAVGLVAYTGHQALAAKDALELVAGDFARLSAELSAGHQQAARRTLADAQVHALDARDNTTGAGWWLTARVPGLGPNVTAVQTIAGVADQLSTGVLPDVVDAAGALEPSNLRPEHGRIDLARIERAAPGVVEADRRLQIQTQRVDALSSSGLAPQIAEPVRLLQARLGSASGLSSRAARAVRLLPSMLGAHGKRTYLVIFQNNAELRATGGIPGAFATITADHGVLSFGSQSDAGRVGPLAHPVLPLSTDERALFGTKLGIFPQDVNLTPDFPRSAELIRAMWQRRTGQSVDGVVSADPVALSYLLEGTGAVRLPDGSQLDAENAVSSLLNGVYFKIPDPSRQNGWFDAVARRVFSAVVGGQGDPHAVLRGLARATDERRLLLWSSRPAEQRLIASTRLGGALQRRPGADPDLGVYLNDATGSKMDYYLDYATSVASERCQAGRQYLHLEVDLRSSVPRDTSGMPDYVFNSVAGAPRGVVRTTIQAYLPVGGWARAARVDGTPVVLDDNMLYGHRVAEVTVDVLPGRRRVLSLDLVSGKGQTGDPVLRTTPGARGSGVGAVSRSAC